MGEFTSQDLEVRSLKLKVSPSYLLLCACSVLEVINRSPLLLPRAFGERARFFCGFFDFWGLGFGFGSFCFCMFFRFFWRFSSFLAEDPPLWLVSQSRFTVNRQ